MKLKESVIITEVAGEYMLVEVENESGTAFHGIIKLNETADFMAEAMREDITEEALADKVMDEYDVEISVDDLVPENFNSVQAIFNLIENAKD